MIWRGT